MAGGLTIDYQKLLNDTNTYTTRRSKSSRRYLSGKDTYFKGSGRTFTGRACLMTLFRTICWTSKILPNICNGLKIMQKFLKKIIFMCKFIRLHRFSNSH